MPSPLDFLHRNNNQDEWAKRYVGNKMGIQQMQEGGDPEMPWGQKAQNAIRDMRMGWLAKKDPQLRAYLDDTGIENWQGAIARGRSSDKFTEDNEGALSDFTSDQSTEFTKGGMKGAILRNIMKEQIKDGNILGDFSEEFSLETDKGKYNLEQFNPLGRIRMQQEGYQHGGPVFESAPADETAHDQMNNLLFENEMKQSQGASPFSFLNQDRIDEQNQLIMDAVTGSAGAMGTVTKGVSSLLGSGTVPKQKLRDFIYNKMFKASEHGKGQPFFSRVQSLKKQFESLKNVDDLYVTKGSRRLPAYFKPPGPDWYNPVTKTWKDELVPWSKGSKKFKELADKMIKEAETAHKKYYPEPKPPRQYQHGGAVFESAIPDETAHSQMNELLAQDEIQQMEQSFKQHGSMGVAPISFVGDPGSLDMVSGPFSKAGSLIAPFNKNIFSILAKMAKESKRAEGAKELYKIKKKSEPFFGKITEEDILNYRKSGKTIYGNKLLRKAMKEYNEHRMVRPSTEINLKNLYR